MMAHLTLRKLDDRIYAQLRMRSLAHHVSVEEEALRIISTAVSFAPLSLYGVFEQCFGQYSNNSNDVDAEGDQLVELIAALRVPHQPVEFEA